MAYLNNQNRLLVPIDLIDLREKHCFVYYDYMTQELFISPEEYPESHVIDSINFDNKNRFVLGKEIRSCFSIEHDTLIVFSVKQNNLYIKKGPLNI